MKVGIGLPSTIPGTTGRRILEWATTAESAGFSTLGTIDRVVYGNHETIPTLAAAAAVTERIGLTTAILIAPFRGNGTLLAKQLASIDSISGGRLTVGLAVGGREDDYQSTGSSFHERGATFERQLAEIRAVWDQEPRGFAGPVGPPPSQAGGPPLLLGGHSDVAYRRTVERGAGWIAGGGGPEMFAAGAERVRAEWKSAGREGVPRLAALTYFSLGDDARDHARTYLTDYYGFLGDFAATIADGALTSTSDVRQAVDAYEAAGCDELIMFPCNADVDQVTLAADVAAG